MTARRAPDLDAVLSFLPCPTPASWFAHAAENLPLLLIDHANCEKKAAGNALSMLYRYVDRPELLFRLSRLAREELRHFEQVHAILLARGIDYVHVTAGRYAGRLRALVRTTEPQRLVDSLLMGAIVEARSCERFAGLIDVVPEDLGRFYAGLLASEARHFQHYLALARQISDEPVDEPLSRLLAVERALVTEPDPCFRFHSGPPADDRSI
ncbi:MAG: tRNA-(ms[2]io[6]A)-hydroxylase [Pseudomonadales bacterium]